MDISKIGDSNRSRKAVVYVRQSTEKQVLRNKESQRIQYGLKDQARTWGWEEIEIIDDDLGVSAASGGPKRKGFEQLLVLVTLGKVGIILCSEASRLARNDTDWCRLMEVCQFTDTLVSDGDHIYNSNEVDDQLLLGIRGTISVVELQILQKRLLQGMETKARRGEFKRSVPAGYVWNKLNKVEKDPDQRVQDALALVFSTFQELQSIRQTVKRFQERRIALPVYQQEPTRHIEWQIPRLTYMNSLLKNPFYAGVYVWGQSYREMEYSEGRVKKTRKRHADPQQARVFNMNNHEPYISWETYEENQRLIAKNRIHKEHKGIAGNGSALMSGLLRCGYCGRKIAVRYGKNTATYVCRGSFECEGNGIISCHVQQADILLSEQVLKALSPYGIEASLEAIRQLSERDQQWVTSLRNKLKQAEYEVLAADERYHETDPRNRLVAAELERRWNEKMEALECIRSELQEWQRTHTPLTDTQQEQIRQLGKNFHEVWHHEQCSNCLRKKIIRTVVEEITLSYDAARCLLIFVIHWEGGHHTSFEMLKRPRSSSHKTSVEDIEIIRTLAPRYTDIVIARVLARNGRTTGRNNPWNHKLVAFTRRHYGIKSTSPTPTDPLLFSLSRAATYLTVPVSVIQLLVSHNLLHNYQLIPYAPWEISKADLDSDNIRQIIENYKLIKKVVISSSYSNSTTSSRQLSLDFSSADSQ